MPRPSNKERWVWLAQLVRCVFHRDIAPQVSTGRTVMRNADRVKLLCGIAVAALAVSAVPTYAQDANSAPNPYRLEDGWAKQPMGRGNGSTIGLNVDRDGKSMWIYDRCGGNSC